MATLPGHLDREWLDLVADLLDSPLTRWPDEQVARTLARTFGAPASTYYSHTEGVAAEQRGWPPEHFVGHFDEASRWAQRWAPTRHPILRYHLGTGDFRCMQVADVPDRFADRRIVAEWTELGRRWGGVQAQLSVPLVFSAQTRRSFVVGRTDPHTDQEMEVSRRLQWLLAGLDREITAFARWSGQHATIGTDSTAAVDAAAALNLTPRELAVLSLLAGGLTAASIGRRLAIAERTVQKHLQRCYTKLGVADRLAAVQRAQHVGLLTPT